MELENYRTTMRELLVKDKRKFTRILINAINKIFNEKYLLETMGHIEIHNRKAAKLWSHIFTEEEEFYSNTLYNYIYKVPINDMNLAEKSLHNNLPIPDRYLPLFTNIKLLLADYPKFHLNIVYSYSKHDNANGVKLLLRYDGPGESCIIS